MKASPRDIQLALLLTAIGLGAGLTSCAPIPFSDSSSLSPASYYAAPTQEVDLIDMSHKLTDALVAELLKNHPSYQRNRPILVTNYVTRSNVDSSSEWGLLIADHVASRLTQHGFVVIEPKLRHDLAIRSQEGEFILTRDLDKLPKEYRAYAVVTGTYTKGREAIDFTTRMVQISNQQVLASVDAKLPVGSGVRELLNETGTGSVMPVVDR